MQKEYTVSQKCSLFLRRNRYFTVAVLTLECGIKIIGLYRENLSLIILIDDQADHGPKRCRWLQRNLKTMDWQVSEYRQVSENATATERRSPASVFVCTQKAHKVQCSTIDTPRFKRVLFLWLRECGPFVILDNEKKYLKMYFVLSYIAEHHSFIRERPRALDFFQMNNLNTKDVVISVNLSLTNLPDHSHYLCY